MRTETFEYASAIVCAISAIPYIYRTYRHEVDLQITSWVLWSFIGLAVLVTYDSAGDGATYWAAIVSFINPSIIALMLILEGGKWSKLSWVEYLCIACSTAALAFWLLVHTERDMSQFALYLALVADLCAAIPTIRFVWANPNADRPGAWVIFAIGMSISLFAVTEWTPANVAYAAYMILGCTSTALPLVLYRIKHQIPLKQWI